MRSSDLLVMVSSIYAPRLSAVRLRGCGCCVQQVTVHVFKGACLQRKNVKFNASLKSALDAKTRLPSFATKLQAPSPLPNTLSTFVISQQRGPLQLRKESASPAYSKMVMV